MQLSLQTLVGICKNYQVFVFDFDKVLLPPAATNTIKNHVISKMILYVMMKRSCSYSEAKGFITQVKTKHNVPSTALALYLEGWDYDLFLNTVLGDMPLSYISATETGRIRHLLTTLNGTLIVFSNNEKKYIELMLNIMGIRDLFTHVVATEPNVTAFKPNVYAYQRVTNLIGVPLRVLFFDDDQDNIIAARSLSNWDTVLVNPSLKPTAVVSTFHLTALTGY